MIKNKFAILERIIIFSIIFTIFFLGKSFPALAENFVDISKATSGTNYTLISPQQKIKLQISGQSHQEDVYIKALTLVVKDKIANYFDLGEMVPTDDLYSIKLTPFIDGLFSSRPQLTISYDDDNRLKEPYWFDWREMRWKKLEAQKDTEKRTFSFTVPEVEEVIFTLFSQSELEGNASWYVHPKYPYELMAASTIFPFGTKLRVIALNSGKEVVVTVKDYGPDKIIHPDRVLDLGREAFKVLAPIGAGIIPVRVELYQEGGILINNDTAPI